MRKYATAEERKAARRASMKAYRDKMRGNPAYEAKRQASRDEYKRKRPDWRQHGVMWQRAYRARQPKRPAPAAPLILLDPIYSAAAACVPRGLPRDARDDIIGDLVLAAFEGRATVGDMKAAAKAAMSKHYWAFCRSISLDDVAKGDGRASMLDRVDEHGEFYRG